MAASNLLYNEGLQKAKARDLSGAIETLTRSIKFNKKNTDARNLLGLIYFEIGETVLALRQWVISSNLQPERNIASGYLKKIQDNQNNFDKLNTSIKKYNQALAYIQQGSTDLAMIQLKKILTISPNFVKAICLLALVYYKEGDIPRAKKELVKALSVDKSNYIARKYYEELSDGVNEGALVTPEMEVKKERVRARRQIIINQSVQQFLGVVFGLAIGVALILFLILPGRLNAKDEEIEANQEQLETANEQMVLLDDTITKNKDKIKELELDLKNALSENDQLASKDEKVQKLMLAMATYLDGNLYESAAYLDTVDINDSTDGVLNSLYEQLVSIVYSEVNVKGYNEGKYAYDRYDYETAIERLELVVKYLVNENFSDDAHYYLARSYQVSGREAEAIKEFKIVLSDYPDSDKRNWARDFIVRLGGTVD
jgi:tetratricopeptide (TPR) repeat protein